MDTTAPDTATLTAARQLTVLDAVKTAIESRIKILRPLARKELLGHDEAVTVAGAVKRSADTVEVTDEAGLLAWASDEHSFTPTTIYTLPAENADAAIAVLREHAPHLLEAHEALSDRDRTAVLASLRIDGGDVVDLDDRVVSFAKVKEGSVTLPSGPAKKHAQAAAAAWLARAVPLDRLEGVLERPLEVTA